MVKDDKRVNQLNFQLYPLKTQSRAYSGKIKYTNKANSCDKRDKAPIKAYGKRIKDLGNCYRYCFHFFYGR